MTIDLSRLLVQPAGFGKCAKCAHLGNDSPDVCYACARRDIEDLAPPSKRCRICDRPHDPPATTCPNPSCNWSRSYRYFGWNYAIGMRKGALERVMKRYKFGDEMGWRVIFARLLVAFMDEREKRFAPFHYIIPSPAYTGPGGHRSWDHASYVIESAAQLTPRWPFYVGDPPLIKKTAETPPMSKIYKFGPRKDNAEGPIRSALEVPSPSMVAGKNILVYDDLFTDGLTLREVARALSNSGAKLVCGVTLARQPWNK